MFSFLFLNIDNTSWQCTHCTDQFRDEIKSKSSADSGKAKSSLLNKPPAKQITPTVITGGGAIVSSKSLLPKVSPTVRLFCADDKLINLLFFN